MKLCLAILLLVTITGGQSHFSDVPLDNPFTSFAAPPVRAKTVSGKVLATIRNGDLVHPTFSPDGRVLAYSNVLSRGDSESTEVLLYDLSGRKASVLLDSKRAEKYATYKTFVAGMEWRSPRRLEVLLGDGDVDLTRLIFDPRGRKLLRERDGAFDETEAQPMPPTYVKARRQAVSLFPAFPQAVLDNALRNTALVIPDRGIVLQKNYAGHDDNVWFLDFQSGAVKPLITLSADSPRAFGGGVAFNSSIILLLSHGQKAYLFLYRDGKIRGLGEFDSAGPGRVEVKHLSPSRVIFLVRTHADYERGDNPLFVFDGAQLFRVKVQAELYDAAVDPGGRRIALCHWAGGERHLVVKDLN